MDSFGATHKRGRSDEANGNDRVPGSKRSKELKSGQPGLGSKSKPCTKFFSTAGCPFGEGCHFLHYVAGGYNSAAGQQMSNPTRNPTGQSPVTDGTKSRMCKKFNTPEGCKFGERCHFAHGERELVKHIVPVHHEPPIAPSMPMPMPMPGRFSSRFKPPPPVSDLAATFGASATAKISVDASLAGAIIGKSGANAKQVCRVSGARLAIREHESDSNLRNIELEGTFDQIKEASAMVGELIFNMSAGNNAVPTKPAGGGGGGGGGGGPNYKTKLCEKFSTGSCTFGDRCNFAHGVSQLRNTATT